MSVAEIKFETSVVKGSAEKTAETTSVFLAFSSSALKSGLMLRESRRRETAK